MVDSLAIREPDGRFEREHIVLLRSAQHAERFTNSQPEPVVVVSYVRHDQCKRPHISFVTASR
jgi:hypothetical protein